MPSVNVTPTMRIRANPTKSDTIKRAREGAGAYVPPEQAAAVSIVAVGDKQPPRSKPTLAIKTAEGRQDPRKESVERAIDARRADPMRPAIRAR
jgi:hypothetical protein